MKLDEYLKKHGLSQEDFGKKIGVSQGLIWQYIDGRTRVPAERARAIEDATAGEVTRHDLRPDLFDEPVKAA